MESDIEPIKFDCEVCDENFQKLSSVVGDIIEQKFNRGIKEERICNKKRSVGL